MEVWGGIECTINRVGDSYLDQLEYSGHYRRERDIELFSDLGIRKIRYPILWEKHQPSVDVAIDWQVTESKLSALVSAGIEPIAGLVHHGSGPDYVSLFDDSFAEGLAKYAAQVIQRFPFLNYFTPVNEPLTTARFCGLYGLWFPHRCDDKSFVKILLSECKAIAFSMLAIRKVNPEAKLVHTEDLGKTHSTPLLKYQADFENQRRWLASDILCGRVDAHHPLFDYLITNGINSAELQYFIDNPCPPDILGFNHYLTSERYLDERTHNFPLNTIGGNQEYRYADVEVVRVGNVQSSGPYKLLKEAWDKYRLPLAITEAHLHCTREEQLRWLALIWETAGELKKAGVNIKAVTFWSLLGSFGWNRLLTAPGGDYESGVFDITGREPRATILSKMIRTLGQGAKFDHPVLGEKGWWELEKRILYNRPGVTVRSAQGSASSPVIIIGKTGTLGYAFGIHCASRNIHYHLLDRQTLDITNAAQIERVILDLKPWAIINTAGYVRVDDAEDDSESCYHANTNGPRILAEICSRYDIKLLIFSSDLVFDGAKTQGYLESDLVCPLNTYGDSKARAEREVLRIYTGALIIRTAAFFGPWDQYNFVTSVLNTLKNGGQLVAEKDVLVSPTYIPDLVDNSLNLLLDDECGIWHLSNDGMVSWADLATDVAARGKLNGKQIKPVLLEEMNYKAARPKNSALASGKGIQLPALGNALDRYFTDVVSCRS